MKHMITDPQTQFDKKQTYTAHIEGRIWSLPLSVVWIEREARGEGKYTQEKDEVKKKNDGADGDCDGGDCYY